MPNAASVKSIPQITISNRAGVTFDAGKFDNAYIKALNLDIGLIDNPTSINIGLIEEQGNYRDYPLTYLDEYNLRIGSDLSIQAFNYTLNREYSYHVKSNSNILLTTTRS